MRYFIKGDKDRGYEVIELLTKSGALNRYCHHGCDDSLIYYIDKNCIIKTTTLNNINIIESFCTELKLPEKWIPKFKMDDKFIRPNGVEVKICGIDNYKQLYTLYCEKDNKMYSVEEDYFKELTWVPKFKIGDKVIYHDDIGTVESIGYYTYKISFNGGVYQFLNDNNFTKYIEWKPLRGETVLVRDTNNQKWQEAVFSHMENDFYFTVGGRGWCYCTQFDINKLGKK